ncbi:MAG: DMT family transporter [Burkholderiaceae bacterium]
MTDRRSHLDGIAIGLMLACCVLWGLQQVVVKVTLPVLPPFVQGAVRSAIAALLLWAWSFARGIPLFGRDGTLVPGLAAGALFGFEFICIYGALTLTDASRVSVFIYMAPFVVALGLPRFAPAERLSPTQMFGLACAFAALAFAFQEGFMSPRRSQWLGDALAIMAAMLWGATTLMVRATRLTSTSPEKTLFYQLAVSTLVIYVASLVAGEQWPSTPVPLWAWGSLIFQSVVVAFASYLAWFWLLRRYPATRLSAFSFLTPMFGLVFAAIALGESISLRLVIALIFIAIGIWLVNRKAALPKLAVNE